MLQPQPLPAYRYYQVSFPRQWEKLEEYIRRDEETAIIRLPLNGQARAVEYVVYVRGCYVWMDRSLAEAEATLRRVIRAVP